MALGVGAAGAESDPKDSAEYKGIASQLDDATGQVDELTAQIGDLPDREEAVQTKEDELKERESDVKAAENAVAKREKKVGIVEQEIKSNTISGDGTYEVGVDMKPGKYKSKSESDCYWSVNADPNGNNILSNGLSSGPQTVTVAKGQYFETADCGDWVRQ